MLGIVLHATLSFVPASVPIWTVEDTQRSTFLAILFFIIHIFRMTTFFLIAGFFARLSLHRRGLRDFIADRLKRIALPLAVAWPIIFVSIVALAFRDRSSALQLMFSRFTLAHLWFLYVLLELYAAVLILRAGVALIDRETWIRRSGDRVFGAIMRNPFGPVIVALPAAIIFAADRKWLWVTFVSPFLAGIPTPARLLTSPRPLLVYAFAFGIGWMLHRNMDLLHTLARRWRPNLIVAIVTSAASGAMMVAISRVIVGPTVPGSLIVTTAIASAACYAAATWTATFALIGVALRYASHYSAARRYVADSSYWLYLVHLPVVMALQAAVSNLDWPWPIKFTFILTVGLSLLFASYQLLVRHRFIGAVLNGGNARDAVRARFASTRLVAKRAA